MARTMLGEATDGLTGFKSDGRNPHLPLRGPGSNEAQVRYLEALLYELATRLGAGEWEKIRNIRRREIGDPLTVRVNGQTVCLDYLQAVLELEFIEKELDLQDTWIMEIGSGYGCICHAMLSNYDIAGYAIIGSRDTLTLTRSYLRAVLSDAQYAKVRFIRVTEAAAALRSSRFEPAVFDLCVNVQSFTEKSLRPARAHLGLIDRKCTAFFAKSPVGTYAEPAVAAHRRSGAENRAARANGPLRQLADLHGTEAVEAASADFRVAHRPGPAWSCAADGRGVPWSHFWQALYKKASVRP
ncbi:putative sugar O-methyltransferase [Streptomyces sp. NPDC058812]|uniref:putative sugar O-methyltransferase n=1 Tax=unclassified Streptomyces TaxID=2593676 RepID=UPI0036D12946